MEEVKKKELELFDQKKKIAELETRLKQQQNLTFLATLSYDPLFASFIRFKSFVTFTRNAVNVLTLKWNIGLRIFALQ